MRYAPSPSPTLPKGRAFKLEPLPNPPQGRESILAVFKEFSQDSFPLGKAGMGLLWWTERIPGNSVGVAIPQPRVAGEARYPG